MIDNLPVLLDYKRSSKGYSLLVQHKDRTILSKYDGAIEELNFKYSMDTIYDLASLTKVMCTAPLILKLLDSGKITLKDSISDLGIFEKYMNIQKFTIENLITHTSGLIPDKPLWIKGTTREDYLMGIDEEAQKAVPWEREEYSDLNFILLGFIIEELFGKPLDQVFQQEISNPLELRYTSFNPKFPNEMIAPTESTKERGLVWGKVHDEKSYYLGGVAGHAGLFSNASDLLKLVNSIRYGKLFSIDTYKLSTRNRNVNIGGIFGLGWMVKTPRPANPSKSFDLTGFMGDYSPYGVIGHTGFTGTSILIDDINDLIIILLTNRVYPTRENNLNIRFRRLVSNSVYRVLGIPS